MDYIGREANIMKITREQFRLYTGWFCRHDFGEALASVFDELGIEFEEPGVISGLSPGLWYPVYDEKQRSHEVVTSDDKVIADGISSRADAKLMATSKKLLEAAVSVLELIDSPVFRDHIAVANLRGAIRAAGYKEDGDHEINNHENSR